MRMKVTKILEWWASGNLESLNTPTGLSVDAVDVDELVISWNASPNATGYVVQRSLNPDFTFQLVTAYSGPLLTFNDDGLDGSSVYYYRVKATAPGYLDSEYSAPIYSSPSISGVDLDSMTGRYIDWDFDDSGQLIIDGSTNLQQVTDKGTSGLNGVPSSSGVRPPYLASDPDFNGRGSIQMTTGKQLNNTSVVLSSPVTIYYVVKLPNLNAAASTYQLIWGNTAGSDGVLKGSGGSLWGIYTGVTPFNSTSESTPNRLTTQIIKVVLKDTDSFWLEINDEPVREVMFQDGAGTTTLTAINRIVLNGYTNIKFGRVMIFNELIARGVTKDLQIKLKLMSLYNVQFPDKEVIHFGDSHTSGTLSPASAGNSYCERLINNQNCLMVNIGWTGTVVNPGTTPQGASRNLSNWYIIYNKVKYAKSFVFMQYGTNDCAIRNNALAPTRAQWIQYYKDYIQAFIDVGFDPTKIVLITPPYSTGAYVAGHLPDLVSDVHNIAADKGVTVIDWYAADLADGYNCASNPDAIHANSDQHNNVYQLCVTYLNQF